MDVRTRRWIQRWVVGDLSLRRLATSIAFIYGSLCVMGLVLPDRLLYLPHPSGYADAASVIKLSTAHGPRISARFDEVTGAPFTVLYSHGNAEDLEDGRWLVHRFNGLGLSVLSYDYEGYGTSEGKPSEGHLYADIDAAYDHLTRALRIPPERILLYGRSLGGGPTVDLARRRPVGGVMLESTFQSAFRVATRVRILPWDQFDNLSKIREVRCPLLVMHGTDDHLIPLAHGRALFDAAPGPKRAYWVTGAGHAEVPFVDGERYVGALRDFIALAGPVAPTAETAAATASSASTGSSAAPPATEAPASPLSPEDIARLREYVIRAQSSAAADPSRSPEAFARSMKGTLGCGKRTCRAGEEKCVVSPDPAHPARCAPVDGWIDHRTPRPRGGFPGLAGITACAGSHNCPAGTVCCLHEIGQAEVQAVVCHADVSECRDREEICTVGAAGDCRTPGTKCAEYRCVPR